MDTSTPECALVAYRYTETGFPKTPSWYEARREIGLDLFKEGRITLNEFLRLDSDAHHMRDTGEIRFCENREYWQLKEEGVVEW